MTTLTVLEETCALDLSGMVEVLRRMISLIFPTSVHPRYTLYRQQVTTTRVEYWADIQLLGLLPGEKRPNLFKGRSMATPALAFQMAAWETIPRIRHLYAPNSSCPALFFFPSHPNNGTATRIELALQERDPALGPLMHLFASQYNLFYEIIDELAITRRALACLHNPSEPDINNSLSLAVSDISPTPAEEVAMVLDAPLHPLLPRHRLQAPPTSEHLLGQPLEKEGSSRRTVPKQPSGEAIVLD